MCLNRKFLVISLICYAVFQLFQVGSSCYTVFFAYEHGLNIQLLAVFHVIVFTTSSVLLVLGALKSKANLLIIALAFLFYKVGFVIWHFGKFYELTFGCVDHGDDSSCDPNRLYIVYKHFFVTGKIIAEVSLSLLQLTVINIFSFFLFSLFDHNNRSNTHIDHRTQKEMSIVKESMA